MITAVTQRWRQGRTGYLPRREVIRPAEFEVALLKDDGEAKQFIVRHHYSRSYPAARRRFGLYRRGQLVGCAVFSHPTHTKALTNVFDVEPILLLELGRLVLLDEVEANGESWFVSRCFDNLQHRTLSPSRQRMGRSIAEDLERIPDEERRNVQARISYLRKEKKYDLIAKIISLQILIDVRDKETMRLREEILRLTEQLTCYSQSQIYSHSR